MAYREPDTIPNLKPLPTRRLPAMADWTPEHAELARDPKTLVWEDAPDTVVEVPWWLREKTEGEPTRREGPWSKGLAPVPPAPVPRIDEPKEPEVMVFVPIPDALVFETEEPTIQRFPREPTRYDIGVSPSGEEPTDTVVPLARTAPLPQLPALPHSAWSVALLGLLAVALGSLAGVVARLVELLPR